jgi:anti-sigma B factor antagonist
MKLTFEDHEQMTVMALAGDLAAEDSDRLRKVATERFEHRVRDFVLDLSALEFVDSKGLETLLWLQEQATERLGQVRLAACQQNVAKILEITRLTGRFDCHSEIESAIKSLR